MIRLSEILDESEAGDEAKQKGLDYMSFGRYGKDGQVTHVVDPTTHKLVPKPAGADPARSQSPDGARSNNSVKQAPPGEYGNTTMPTTMPKPAPQAAAPKPNAGVQTTTEDPMSRLAAALRGREEALAKLQQSQDANDPDAADRYVDYSNKLDGHIAKLARQVPPDQMDPALTRYMVNRGIIDDPGANDQPEITGKPDIRSGPPGSKHDVHHGQPGEQTAPETERIVQSKYGGDREKARADITGKLKKAMSDPTMQQYHPNLGNDDAANLTGTGRMLGPQRHAGAADRTKYLRRANQVQGLAKMLQSLKYLDAQSANATEEDPEHASNDASGASHFGPDESVSLPEGSKGGKRYGPMSYGDGTYGVKSKMAGIGGMSHSKKTDI